MAEYVTPKSIVRTRTTRPSRCQRVQNFTLIWLDSNIDQTQQDLEHSLSQLRSIVTTIDTFTDVDRCVDFLDQLEKVKVFMIISDALVQTTLPRIHDRSELDSIYVFCGNKVSHETWAKRWPKITGVFTKIDELCGALKGDTEQCDRSSIAISVTTSDLDHLDPSFMYTQLLKEILLKMDYEEKQEKDFVHLCRDLYQKDGKQMKIIDEFEHHYDEHTPIWWYTRECFTYQLLNQALRTQDVRVLIKIGYFLRDVHRHIEQLYSETTHSDGVFVVYRGQGMCKDDFTKIKQCEGGLLAFNNFLSTSFDEKVSMGFARQALNNPQYVGILFKMSIDRSMSSAPFAELDNISYYEASEKELLFSMHTVFRIGCAKMIADRLWQVNVTLNDDAADRELQQLTQHMREEVTGGTGWDQLAKVLLKTGNYEDAEEIYQTLMEKARSNNDEQRVAHLNHQLAWVKRDQGEYQGALDMCQKSLDIKLKSLPPNHPDLAATYSRIGSVHDKMGEYPKALEYHQKCLDIRLKSLPSNPTDLAITYSELGLVHDKMGEYSKALEFHQKSLDIKLKSLPPNHPRLATTYSRIGSVHDRMGEYSKALEFHQMSLDIKLKSLPPNHPSLAITYSNIGLVHEKMGEYSKALEFHQKSLDIRLKSLPPNHPELAITYNNVGSVHDTMGEYSKALEFLQTSLDIKVKSLPPDHPSLAVTCSNIGSVYDKVGEYSKALEFHQKCLDIRLKSLPPNHPEVAASYRNIGMVEKNLKQFKKASDLYRKSLEISEGSLSSTHPRLGYLYNKVGELHESMGEHEEALAYYDKALQIQEKCLCSRHLDLATTIHNMGSIKSTNGEYKKALDLFNRALEMRKRSLPANHPDIACSYHGIALVHEKTGEHSKGLSCAERAVQIGEHSLAHEHPHVELYRDTLNRLQKRV